MIFQYHKTEQWQNQNFWTILIHAIVGQTLFFLSKQNEVLLFSPSYPGISPAVKSAFYTYL